MRTEEMISRFVEELENFFNECQEKLNERTKQINSYNYIRDLIEVLQKSKYAFAEGVCTLNKERLEEYNQIVSQIVTSEEEQTEIFNEAYNLYKLQQSGLINYPELAPQIEDSTAVLENFKNRLENYLQQIDIETLTAEREVLENYSENIVDLGDKFSDTELIEHIENIPFFYNIVESTDFKEKEKLELIKYALFKNIELYNEALISKEDEIISTFEESKANSLEELNSSQEESISKEYMQQLDEMLNDEILKTKLIAITDEEYSDIDSYKEVDSEIAEEIIAIVKEEIINLILENNISPEEAAMLYIEQNDIIGRESREKLTNILEYLNDEQTSEEEITNVLNKANNFILKNRKLLENMTTADREVQENYIKELYKDQESRVALYKNKSYTDMNLVNQDAVYEIAYFTTLIKNLNPSSEKDMILISKACKRIEEVFESLYIVTQDTEKDFFIEPASQEEDVNLFFLMKNGEKSFLENDIRFDSQSKGFSKAHYKDINEILNKIKQQGEKLPNQIKSVWKNLRNMRVKAEYNGKIIVFYIPINSKDIIILDALEVRKGNFYNEEDARVKMNESIINSYIEKITNPKTREEAIAEANIVYGRIKSFITSNESDMDTMLDEMFAEETLEELSNNDSTKK